MYSKNRLLISMVAFRLFAIALVFASGVARADSLAYTLAIEPNRCIALQQGQVCYADLKFQWKTPATGEYCLYDERPSDPLLCWMGNTVTVYKQKFSSRKNVNYEIRLKSSEQPLAQATVKVSWIYKSNTSSTSRWRLF